jgi:hypothetical protein
MTKINWHVFFGILLEQIGRPENMSSPNPSYPLPSSFVNQPEKHLIYKGIKVRKADWVNFI